MVGEPLSRDFARFGYIDESVGIVGINNILDLVDLFFLDDANEHIVFESRIEADRLNDGNSAVEFLGDCDGDFFVLVRDDIEHQRGLQTGLYDVRDFGADHEGNRGVEDRAQYAGGNGGRIRGFEVETDESEGTGGDDDDEVATEYQPLHVRNGVVFVDDFADDVRTAHAGVVAEDEAEADTATCTARRSREKVQRTVGTACLIKREVHEAEHTHPQGVHTDRNDGEESELLVEDEERRNNERDVQKETRDRGVEPSVRKVLVEGENGVVNDRRDARKTTRRKPVGNYKDVVAECANERQHCKHQDDLCKRQYVLFGNINFFHISVI